MQEIKQKEIPEAESPEFPAPQPGLCFIRSLIFIDTSF